MVDKPEAIPEEHLVECICELLSAIGFTLESNPAGKSAVTQVCGRLMDLKTKKKKDGKQVYPKRIQFAIQDLLDMRQAGWMKKSFKTSAMTLEQVKEQQERDERDAKGGKVTVAERVVAGAAPTCLNPGAKDSPG